MSVVVVFSVESALVSAEDASQADIDANRATIRARNGVFVKTRIATPGKKEPKISWVKVLLPSASRMKVPNSLPAGMRSVND